MLLERYDYSLPMQYLAYVLWTIVLALASAIIVKGFCYPAAGSGIPDLKSMFSGFFKKETVAVRVLILKSIALLLSYGSGLSVGKEGPYVHLAACVANVLLCFKPFSTEVGSNETKRTMMLAGLWSHFASFKNIISLLCVGYCCHVWFSYWWGAVFH